MATSQHCALHLSQHNTGNEHNEGRLAGPPGAQHSNGSTDGTDNDDERRLPLPPERRRRTAAAAARSARLGFPLGSGCRLLPR